MESRHRALLCRRPCNRGPRRRRRSHYTPPPIVAFSVARPRSSCDEPRRREWRRGPARQFGAGVRAGADCASAPDPSRNRKLDRERGPDGNDAAFGCPGAPTTRRSQLVLVRTRYRRSAPSTRPVPCPAAFQSSMMDHPTCTRITLCACEVAVQTGTARSSSISRGKARQQSGQVHPTKDAQNALTSNRWLPLFGVRHCRVVKVIRLQPGRA